MISHVIRKKEAWSAAMVHPEYDMALLQRIAAGDELALHDLYAAHGQRLYAYALRLTGDAATAEDVVQDALIAVWRTAGRYRGEGRVLAWLLGIVHNTATKAFRHRSEPLADEVLALPAREEPPEQQAEAGERSRWVREGLQSLSPDHRAVLELVFYQGLSLAETAQVCNCPVGTVKSRLSYARRHLRGILAGQDVEEWR